MSIMDASDRYYSAKALFGTLCLGYFLGSVVPHYFAVSGKGRILVVPSLGVVLLVGILIGGAATVAMIAIALYNLTHARPKYLEFEKRAKVVGKEGNVGGSKEEENERDVTKQGSTMPHAIAYKGKYQGVVFTVPMSKWSRSKCVLDWPPLASPFKAWFAEIDQGTLILHPIPSMKRVDSVRSGVVNVTKGDAMKTTDGAGGSKVSAEKLGIPMEGCIVEIVRDGLLGRSEMIRRAPLFICHEKWLLLDGEHGFYLFAENPGAKLQWAVALRYWAENRDKAFKTVPEMYEEYCSIMSQNQPVLPYVSENNVDDPIEVRPSEPIAVSRRKRWKSWRRQRAKTNAGADSQKLNNKKLEDLDSMIEEQWMHKGVMAKSARMLDPEDGEFSGHGNVQADRRREERRNLSSGKDKVLSDIPVENQNNKFQYSTLSNKEHWPSDLPTQIPADHFVNDFLARGCFDLVRNPSFAEFVRARVQAQLSRMHCPDYVQSLEVTHIDPGSSAPSVGNFASLPSPVGTSIMPQLVFDMKYEGDFSITIECKVDIRDARGWGALDKAFDFIEGRSGKSDKATDTSSNASDQVWREGEDEISLLEHADGIHSQKVQLAEKSEITPETKTGRPQLSPLESFRQTAAQKLRQLADSTAVHISRIPLRISLKFSLIEGQMCAWVPPPPGNRIFWSFLTPPNLKIDAKPRIGGRFLKYAYHASRASAWIGARMKLAFTKNMVFPSGGDFIIPPFIGIDDPNVGNEPFPEESTDKMEDEAEEVALDHAISQAMGGEKYDGNDDGTEPREHSSGNAGNSGVLQSAYFEENEEQLLPARPSSPLASSKPSPFFEIRLRRK
eukprot:jgi/Picsp_1/6029/NSC_03383-R1_protein isoform b